MLAHQGGWDELLFVLGPILVVVGLLAIARRRISRPGALRDEDVTEPSENG